MTHYTHTLKLRLDEDTEIHVVYRNTSLHFVEFADDAAQMLTEYEYDPSHYVSVSTTVTNR